MAARPRELTELDAADWALFARRIVPLRGARPVAPEDTTAPMPRETPRPEPRAPVRPAVTAQALGIGVRPDGVDTASWERFRRGRVVSARKLDLHGMTAQQAYQALRAFLHASHADRVRCVEVVTGRGDGERGGVLRRELGLWLNLPEIRPLVLAAMNPQSSNAMHERLVNSGSVRLLLRKPRG